MNIDISGVKCLVVGGGAVAGRKVEGLLKCGAAVTVVSPRATADIQALSHQGRLDWEARPFRPEDAVGVFLLFAATDDRAANQRAVEAGKRAGALVNAADDPEGSDFHVPAVIRKGPVTAALSTEGASPALAAFLRDRVAAALPDGADGAAKLLGGLRRLAIEREFEGAPEKMRELLDSGVVEDLADNNTDAARQKTDALFWQGAFSDAMK